ncbi:Hypothetical predicted protein [Paramuricea clavata]|uniref:Uncharacterized protein n=1 Tax=Paramuricea clavata TaxID=317549 RepID=A0A6S7FN05_PARCT|nr:Hypothetical predicted protein [Paramuricea clavata]
MHENQETVIKNNAVAENFWMGGSFETLRDFIAVDDQIDSDDEIESDNPETPEKKWSNVTRTAVVAVDTEDENKGKQLFSIPIEWIPRVAIRNNKMVLMPFEFCCREVIVRSRTQLIRCQSLTIPKEYYCDRHFFHVGCGGCTTEGSSDVQVFAATHLYVGLKTIMNYLNTNMYMNSGEMLAVLESNDTCLNFYEESFDDENQQIYTITSIKGTTIRKYLAHIVVCKYCIRHLGDFLSLLDQSVAHHPCPDHVDIDCDGYNKLGLPIRNYILDADFDMLMSKAYYGIIDDGSSKPCKYVDDFMDNFVIKYD